jgi:hypothetical protein
VLIADIVENFNKSKPEFASGQSPDRIGEAFSLTPLRGEPIPAGCFPGRKSAMPMLSASGDPKNRLQR